MPSYYLKVKRMWMSVNTEDREEVEKREVNTLSRGRKRCNALIHLVFYVVLHLVLFSSSQGAALVNYSTCLAYNMIRWSYDTETLGLSIMQCQAGKGVSKPSYHQWGLSDPSEEKWTKEMNIRRPFLPQVQLKACFLFIQVIHILVLKRWEKSVWNANVRCQLDKY